jgi:uncharacterized OsmC-like protein
MSTLVEYLKQKREAVQARDLAVRRGSAGAIELKATVTAEGRSGIRRIRIRDFQLISDSPPSFAGYDLGPSSPELQLGILGSCLNHTYLIQAAVLQIALESIEVEVTARIDPRARQTGHESTPVYPHAIAYTVRLSSPASDADIAKLTKAVEESCPILNLLRSPQQIEGSVLRIAARPADANAA